MRTKAIIISIFLFTSLLLFSQTENPNQKQLAKFNSQITSLDNEKMELSKQNTTLVPK